MVKKSNKIVYLVSTNRDDVSFLMEKMKLNLHSDLEYIISYQGCGLESFDDLNGKVLFSQCIDSGLSNNRNNAIRVFNENYTDSYAIISDDDVDFCTLNYRDVDVIFNNTSADILTGRVRIDDDTFYKDYAQRSFKHNLKSINKVSSIEIVLKNKVNIPDFDTRFGLGARYKMGEEAIWLGDSIKKGLNVYYYPLDIFYHPYESTSKITDDNWYLSKGAFYRRRYGYLLGLLLTLRISIKRRVSLKKNSVLFDSYKGKKL